MQLQLKILIIHLLMGKKMKTHLSRSLSLKLPKGKMNLIFLLLIKRTLVFKRVG
jgi:hypothetical protein